MISPRFASYRTIAGTAMNLPDGPLTRLEASVPRPTRACSGRPRPLLMTYDVGLSR